ncbi:MAG TPA: thioredoxin [Solirubrobacter sp.]|nr:thioredoxin [Solirubrobacter sp.]
MAIDTSEATFERDVIQRSFEQPVVVDFWAEWCGPCRTLGPIIEQAVDARDGQVSLVKVDTEANPRLASAFRIQSIPAVKAFKDGAVVDEFIGALPPAQVERFLDGLVPSEVDALVAAGDEASLRRALELEPGRADAALPLAKLLAAQGDRDAALAVLERVAGSFAADGLAVRLRLAEDPELAPALAALDAGDAESGLDGLIAAIAASDDADRKDELRRAVVGILDELGPEDPLARESRRKLASALY